MRVRVHTVSGTSGMLITQKHLDVRREGAIGIVMGHVPGHGGDVWWVRHEDAYDEIGAYMFNEFEPYNEQPPETPEPPSLFD